MVLVSAVSPMLAKNGFRGPLGVKIGESREVPKRVLKGVLGRDEEGSDTALLCFRQRTVSGSSIGGSKFYLRDRRPRIHLAMREGTKMGG